MTAQSNQWTEPVIVDPSNPPVYPYNKITQSESGHSIELDDTPSKERVRVQHRSGTFTEMQPNGDKVTKVYGDNYTIIASNNNVMITGQCNITVAGACVIHIQGDALMQIDGDCSQVVAGDCDQVIHGAATITVDDDLDINSSGDITLSAMNVNINADVNVNGNIGSTQSIAAVGNISAAMQVSAVAGVITEGFVSAGSPLPLNSIPGAITGITVGDLVRTIEADRLIFDSHTHGGVQNGNGTTSTPLQSE